MDNTNPSAALQLKIVNVWYVIINRIYDNSNDNNNNNNNDIWYNIIYMIIHNLFWKVSKKFKAFW